VDGDSAREHDGDRAAHGFANHAARRARTRSRPRTTTVVGDVVSPIEIAVGVAPTADVLDVLIEKTFLLPVSDQVSVPFAATSDIAVQLAAGLATNVVGEGPHTPACRSRAARTRSRRRRSCRCWSGESTQTRRRPWASSSGRCRPPNVERVELAGSVRVRREAAAVAGDRTARPRPRPRCPPFRRFPRRPSWRRRRSLPRRRPCPRCRRRSRRRPPDMPPPAVAPAVPLVAGRRRRARGPRRARDARLTASPGHAGAAPVGRPPRRPSFPSFRRPRRSRHAGPAAVRTRGSASAQVELLQPSTFASTTIAARARLVFMGTLSGSVERRPGP